MIYLCVPYSHPDAAVREQRFRAANRVAGILMKRGLHVYSPISHTHPIAVACDLPLGWDYWQEQDKLFIGMAKELWIVTLPGWMESKGIQAEVAIAHERKIPVCCCDADGVLTMRSLLHETFAAIPGWSKA